MNSEKTVIPSIAVNESRKRMFAWAGARIGLLAVVSAWGMAPGMADAATYAVGPGKTYTQLSQVRDLLNPGDIVTVDGDASYSGGVRFSRPGTAQAPITIRGLRVNGTRPTLSGGANTVEFAANYYVMEGFNVTGGSSRCIYHHAHAIVIRDSLVHNCSNQGIISADEDSGSLTVEYVEVTSSGSGTQSHPLYITSDQTAYPGAIFRLQHSYIHDNIGGNAVKSRAERNEIYYNWIQSSLYRALELIGPDIDAGNVVVGRKREDSDVVGNVIRQTTSNPAVRIGGDKDDADTSGRYRFVNNTFITASSSAIFQVFLRVESVELHNNVFYRTNGGASILNDGDASWVGGRAVAGSNNWLQTSATQVPGEITASIRGTDPGFANIGSLDVRPGPGSPLIDAGISSVPSFPGHAFPSPLASPARHPPLHVLEAVGGAMSRPAVGAIDVGAYEYNSGSPVKTPSPPSDLTVN